MLEPGFGLRKLDIITVRFIRSGFRPAGSIKISGYRRQDQATDNHFRSVTNNVHDVVISSLLNTP